MASLNEIKLIGNLGRDPETSYTNGSLAVTKISLATTRYWKDKATGETREKTDWHRVTFFGKTAERLGQYAKKGSQLYIEAHLSYSQNVKNGDTVYYTNVEGDTFQLLGKKEDASASQQNGNNHSQFPPDADIPF